MMLAGWTVMCRKRFCDSFKLKKSWRALETADHPEEVEKHCLSDPETRTFAGRQRFLAFHLENLISGATTSWLRSDSRFQFKNQFFALSFSDLKTSSRPSRLWWKISKISAESTASTTQILVADAACCTRTQFLATAVGVSWVNFERLFGCL